MEGIYQWVRSLVFYLIFSTMLMNLLPDKRYEKYLRLITGVIFLLLFFRPFTDLTGIEARIAGTFEQLSFRNDVQSLKREMEDVDQERMMRMLEGYRKAVETDLETMAETGAMECREVHAALDMDADSESFGSLTGIKIRVGPAEDFSGLSQEEKRSRRYQLNREMGDLKERIGEYYGLEEHQMEIYLEAE